MTTGGLASAGPPLSRNSMVRKVAIVGTAPSGVHAPYNDESWEIWGVGCRASYVVRADRWFELHRLSGEPEDWASEWRNSIKKWSHDCEVWMLYPENLGPKIVEFPHQRITSKFGTFFLTSTFGWMMALAIDEGVDEIGLWGVDMEYGTEYRSQRTGLRHFIDLARVLGIKITRLASGGVAYEPVPYPLIQDDPLLQKLGLRREQAEKNLKEWRESLKRTETMIAVNEALMGVSEDEKMARDTESLKRTADKIRLDIAHLEGSDETHAWMEDFLQP